MIALPPLAIVALAILIIAVAGAVAIALAARSRLAASEAARDRHKTALAEAMAILSTGPSACFIWRASGGVWEWSPSAVVEGLDFDGAPRLDDILARFAPDDGAALGGAVARLQQDGTAFAFTAALASGGALDVAGHRTLSAEGERLADAIWFSDATRREAVIAEAALLAHDRDQLRAAFDALPLPIWRRSGDLALTDCNRAFAAAVDATKEIAIATYMLAKRNGIEAGMRSFQNTCQRLAL